MKTCFDWKKLFQRRRRLKIVFRADEDNPLDDIVILNTCFIIETSV